MVAAIEAARVGKYELSEDCGILNAQFWRGTQRIRVCVRVTVLLPWNLELALEAPQHIPFEPLELVSLK